MEPYILGLLASDGFTGVYTRKDGSNSYYSKLELSEKQIIQDICNKYNIKIHYRKRIIANKEREFWSVRFNNKIIGEYGKYLTKGRKNIKELYDSFRDEDKDEFVRGLFDGDGSVVFKKDKNVKCLDGYRKTVGFSVNYNCPDIKLIIEDFAERHNIIIGKYLDKRGNGSWYLSFNGVKSLEAIFHAFFDKSVEIKNNRKYNIFVDFYNKCCSNNKSQNGGNIYA